MSVFDSVLLKKVGRSKFNLSHTNTLTMKQGLLTPILCKEILPGDRFKLTSEHLLRFQPMLAPIYSNMKCYVHYFFVPNRLCWSHWEKFISQPTSVTSPAPPTIKVSKETLANYGNLGDYLGLPQMPAYAEYEVSALPFAAYQKIWNDYYRNEAIQTEIFEDTEPAITTDGEIDDSVKIGQLCWHFGFRRLCFRLGCARLRFFCWLSSRKRIYFDFFFRFCGSRWLHSF